MKDDDNNIESFFNEMKKADERLEVPPFALPAKTRKFSVFAYGIAAAVALLVAVVWLNRSNGNDQRPAHEILIEINNHELETRSLMPPGEEGLSDWESPTDFLAEDF